MMKAWVAIIGVCGLLAGGARADDEIFDRIDDALTFQAADAAWRARVSGMTEIEAYAFSQPAPGVIETDGRGLLNPRLTLFLDTQWGERWYAFAQVRADRGFDPSDEPLQARVDEVALRFTPWNDGRLTVQAGKFATVVGNWVARHGSWDNPFVTAPLAYEHLTGVWDAEAATSPAMLLLWAHLWPKPRNSTIEDKYLRLPIIWGPSYSEGVAVSGEWAKLTYAAELKNASLSSRPERWTEGSLDRDESTVSGRLGFRPNPMWDVGFSASAGSYLLPTATVRASVPAGRRFRDYREVVIGQDASFAWHHVQLWAEWYLARFEIPGVADARTFSYYVEARYKFTPQFFSALRWSEQRFGDFPNAAGGRAPWGGDVWRIDVAPTYRFTPHVQLKFQYSFQHEELVPKPASHLGAVQFVVRF